MIEYHPTNYRSNLTTYWRQFHPGWKIPKGYHVHHIRPVCTFADKSDPRIHHPRNLIALHIDDHATIHECRGDKLMRNLTPIIMSMKGRKRTPEATKKFKTSMAARKENNAPRKKISAQGRKNMSAGQKLRAPKTEAAINNWRESMALNKANGYVRKPKPHSEETKRNQSIAALKRKTTQAMIDGSKRQADAIRGRKASDETKKKMANAIVRQECPHCGRIIGGTGNYNMYHGDNCKLKEPINNFNKLFR